MTTLPYRPASLTTPAACRQGHAYGPLHRLPGTPWGATYGRTCERCGALRPGTHQFPSHMAACKNRPAADKLAKETKPAKGGVQS